MLIGIGIVSDGHHVMSDSEKKIQTNKGEYYYEFSFN